MGVPGLMTYVLDNSKLYLKPYKLSDCNLVVDGANVAFFLYELIKFGDNYDEYSATVRRFLSDLKKCNIKPIFIFGGPKELSKIKKRIFQRQKTVTKIKRFFKGQFLDTSFSPLLLIEAFLDVVREMKLSCIQCDFEADAEIATVAKCLKCPVLSYDSDFFFHDALYIPFKKVNLNPQAYSGSNKFYMNCLIYDVNDFLKSVEIEKSCFSVLLTLLGNDHKESELFLDLCKHLEFFRNDNQIDFHRVILWFKNQTQQSVMRSLESLLNPEIFPVFLKILDANLKFCETCTISKSLLTELTHTFERVDLIGRDFCLGWPEKIAELYANTFIPSYITHMALYQIYLTPVQLEDIYGISSHLRCLKLIKKIYAMLTPYLRNEMPLTLYLVQKGQYQCLQVEPDQSDINLERALELPWEARLKLLCDIVGASMEKLKFVSCDSWAVFVMSFFYWVNEHKHWIKPAHVHAFVIMTIANKIIQTKVGYFESPEEFMKVYSDKLRELEDTELTYRKASSFKEMLMNVTEYECFLVQNKLMPYRVGLVYPKAYYSISTLHLFNSFQTCLFYIMTINALLNHPLPHLKVGEFYSGTLLLNVYLKIKSDCDAEHFGRILFKETPNLNQIYKFLCEKLCKFL